MVVVLGRLVLAQLAQHAHRGGGGMENIDAEALGYPPRPARVGVGGSALVQHAGGAEGQRAVDDVGVTGYPADVGEAPVGVVGMDVQEVLGRARHIGQVAARRVLGALGPARGAAGVHEKKGRLGRHRLRRHDLAPVVAQDVVHEVVAPCHHGAGRAVLARAAPEHQDLFDLDPLGLGRGDGLVRLGLVVEPFAVPVIAVDGHQHAAGRVGYAPAAGGTRKTGENLRVHDTEAGASQHGHGQVGDHGHVKGDPVADLEATEAFEHGGQLVHPAVELPVSYCFWFFGLGLGDPDKRRLVCFSGQVPVDAVVAGVEPAPHEPLPKRGVGGVERRVPVLVPVEQVGVLPEAFGKAVLAEALVDRRVGRVGLADEAGRGEEVLLLAPVNGYLGLAQRPPGLFRARHGLPLSYGAELRS